MFKEVKYLFLFFIAIFITSCNSSTTTELKQDSILAEELLNKAKQYWNCEFDDETIYFVMVDSSKFGKVMPYTFATLDDVDILITEVLPEESIVEMASQCGTAIVVE